MLFDLVHGRERLTRPLDPTDSETLPMPAHDQLTRPVGEQPGTAARLLRTRVPRRPEGVVLVLHGGAGRGAQAAVSPAQLSVVRMIPIAHRVARAGAGRLAVFRLLNSGRGWNTGHTPVDDVRWALTEAQAVLGRTDLPVSLVGHSLGGRAALLAAAEPAVVSAVALNPWVYPTDVPRTTRNDLRLFIVHGDQDRVASPSRSRALAGSLERVGRVGFASVHGGRHAMLRHGRVFEGLAADLATGTLLGVPRTGAAGWLLGGASFVEV